VSVHVLVKSTDMEGVGFLSWTTLQVRGLGDVRNSCHPPHAVNNSKKIIGLSQTHISLERARCAICFAIFGTINSSDVFWPSMGFFSLFSIGAICGEAVLSKWELLGRFRSEE